MICCSKWAIWSCRIPVYIDWLINLLRIAQKGVYYRCALRLFQRILDDFPGWPLEQSFESLMSCLVMFSSMKTFTLGNPFGELFSTVNDIYTRFSKQNHSQPTENRGSLAQFGSRYGAMKKSVMKTSAKARPKKRMKAMKAGSKRKTSVPMNSSKISKCLARNGA